MCSQRASHLSLMKFFSLVFCVFSKKLTAENEAHKISLSDILEKSSGAGHISELWHRQSTYACHIPCQRVPNIVTLKQVIEHAGLPGQLVKFLRTRSGLDFVDIGKLEGSNPIKSV